MTPAKRSRRSRRTPAGPRLRLTAPLPPLPRALRALDVAYGRRHVDWPRGERFPFSRAAEPFTAAELTPDVKGRLLARPRRGSFAFRRPSGW